MLDKCFFGHIGDHQLVFGNQDLEHFTSHARMALQSLYRIDQYGLSWASVGGVTTLTTGLTI